MNHLSKSVVREIRTLRSVGAGGGRPPPATRWVVSNGHLYRDKDHIIAGAESFYSLEGNMCGTVTRGADALPGSMATSRTKGSRRNLGDPTFDRGGAATSVRIGKARSRSR